jgi:thiol-disulfide isomerase/thioredoxin
MKNGCYKWLMIFGMFAACTESAWSAPKTGIYDSSADGARQVADALATARQTDKTVLVQFGGDWCVPCIQLHHFFETNSAVNAALKSHYVKIDVEVNDRNQLLLTNYHADHGFGIPILVVLDSDGKRLSTVDTDSLLPGTNGSSNDYSTDKVLALLAQWTPEAIQAKTTRHWVWELVNMSQAADKSVQLEQIKKQPVEAVAALLDIIRLGTNANSQIAAYFTLIKLGPLAKSTVPFLIQQFTTNNALIQFTAVSLSGFGPDAKPAVPTLEKILDDPVLTQVLDDPVDRSDSRSELLYCAADCLAKIEPASPALIPTMVKCLGATNIYCRRLAPRILAQLGPGANSAVPALKKASEDTDATVRRYATNALAKITANPPN